MNKFLALAASLNWADYLILIVIGLSIIRGIKRGFIKETVSLITWIAALILSIKFHTHLSLMLVKIISSESARSIIAFIAIFVCVLIIGGLAGALLSQLIKKIGLSIPNRLAGVLFGALRGILIIVLFIILARFTSLPKDEWWKNSALIPKGEQIADIIKV